VERLLEVLRAAGAARVLLAGSMAASAGTADAARLSIDDCLRLASQRNERLAAAASTVQAAEQRVHAARARGRPSASLHGGASYAPRSGFDPALTEGGEYVARLDLEQRLYDQASRLGVQQARLELEHADAERSGAAADLRLDVRLAYIDLVGARRQRQLVGASIADLRSYLATARTLARGGAMPAIDVTRVEIQLATESILLRDLDGAASTAVIRLAEHIGFPVDSTVAVEDSVSLPDLTPGFEPGRSLEMRVAALDLQAAELDVRLARAERRPVVALVAGLGAWTSRGQLLDSDAPHILGYQTGITVDMPLGSWGAATARGSELEAVANRLRTESGVLRRHVASEVALQERRIGVERDKLRDLAAAHRLAEDQFADLLARYAGGVASSFEVLDAHRDLLAIALQAAQSRTALETLHAELLRQEGDTP